jgi:pimeloyl-ACP methyl ester carboxylesterase
MAVFVLVHGAWSGAHGFRKVRGPLRAAGHEVFTPSLTGIGERVHLTSPQVCLTTHITDVVNTVLYEDLRAIVLLGFSYGGFVVTGALEHIGDRIRHLVYLDAFVPDDGDSVHTTAGDGAGRGVIELGGDWLVAPLPREFDDPAEAALGQRAAHAAASRLLHRAGPAGAPAGGLSLHAHLHQGDRGAPARARRAVLGRCRPGHGLASLALPENRHGSHDSQQPARGPRPTPAGADLKTPGRFFAQRMNPATQAPSPQLGRGAMSVPPASPGRRAGRRHTALDYRPRSA